jgi:hypothetical protein
MFDIVNKLGQRYMLKRRLDAGIVRTEPDNKNSYFRNMLLELLSCETLNAGSFIKEGTVNCARLL